MGPRAEGCGESVAVDADRHGRHLARQESDPGRERGAAGDRGGAPAAFAAVAGANRRQGSPAGRPWREVAKPQESAEIVGAHGHRGRVGATRQPAPERLGAAAALEIEEEREATLDLLDRLVEGEQPGDAGAELAEGQGVDPVSAGELEIVEEDEGAVPAAGDIELEHVEAQLDGAPQALPIGGSGGAVTGEPGVADPAHDTP